jgi:hypothetical protein
MKVRALTPAKGEYKSVEHCIKNRAGNQTTNALEYDFKKYSSFLI